MLYDKIKELAKANGVSINKIEKDLNFARGSLCKIDKNKPSAEKLNSIATYFHVNLESLIEENVDFLLNIGNDSNVIIEMPSVDRNYRKIIEQYKNLSKPNQKRILDNMKALYDLQEAEKPIAAHMNKDATQEEIEHDNDIMNDDNFWTN